MKLLGGLYLLNCIACTWNTPVANSWKTGRSSSGVVGTDRTTSPNWKTSTFSWSAKLGFHYVRLLVTWRPGTSWPGLHFVFSTAPNTSGILQIRSTRPSRKSDFPSRKTFLFLTLFFAPQGLLPRTSRTHAPTRKPEFRPILPRNRSCVLGRSWRRRR